MPRHVTLDVAFSPDEKRVAAICRQQCIRIWDAPTGREVAQLGEAADHFTTLVFLPDGKTLLTAGLSVTGVEEYGIVKLWDAQTGTLKRTLKTGGTEWPNTVAVSSDGRTLVRAGAAGLSTIGLVDLVTGRELGYLRHDMSKPVQRIRSVGLSPDGKLLVCGYEEGSVGIWEVASRQRVLELHGHRAMVYTVAFSPDSRTVVSGSSDGTALIWDSSGRTGKGLLPTVRLSAEELEGCWDDLASGDASKAYAALGTFVAGAQQAVPFLGKTLQPVPLLSPQQMARVIARLDAEQFAEREQAAEELEAQAELAETALRRALANKPTAELRRRAEMLLQELAKPVPSPNRLRSLRALVVLERIATPEAQRIMEKIARGAAKALLTQEAQAALERLRKRTPAAP